MPFNSLDFLAFFTILTVTFYAAPARFRQIILLIFSLLYFSSFGLISIFALLTVSSIGFFFLRIPKSLLSTNWGRGLAVFLVVSIWIGFKNLPAISSLIQPAVTINFDLSAWLIHPVGISFYSLQLIAVILDVRLKDIVRSWSFREILLFLGFLPQSMAGPIHRQQELLPQFLHLTGPFQSSNIFIGVKYLVWGYICKLIVGDKLAILVAFLLGSPEKSNGLSLLIGACLYAFQIYFDFYGYSLIAIGLGRILGITVKVNFRKPYQSITFREFWRRWHISLSTWFRDYVYIPLGGNRSKYFRWILVILATFIISGIWHGFGSNFLIWGAVHGLLLIFENLILNKFRIGRYPWLKKSLLFIWWPIFFLIIAMTWLIFRTEEVHTLGLLFSKILQFSEWNFLELRNFLYQPVYLFYLILFMLILVIEQSKRLDDWIEQLPSKSVQYWAHGAGFTIFGLLLILFGGLGGQEFLYLQF